MSAIPQELLEDTWKRIYEQQMQTAEAQIMMAETFGPAAIEREKARYAAGDLAVDEFEQRVEAILHGSQWWEG